YTATRVVATTSFRARSVPPGDPPVTTLIGAPALPAANTARLPASASPAPIDAPSRAVRSAVDPSGGVRVGSSSGETVIMGNSSCLRRDVGGSPIVIHMTD